MGLPTNAQGWALGLGASGSVVDGVAAAEQAIRVVLTTPLGADPTRPSFGCDLWRHLDRPIPKARAAIVSDLLGALKLWVPTVVVLAVVVEPGDAPGAVLLTLSWALAELPDQAQRLEVPIG